MDSLGCGCFSAVVSDSTGNTTLVHKILVEHVPTIIALADLCCHISNFIKDVVELPYFSLVC